MMKSNLVIAIFFISFCSIFGDQPIALTVNKLIANFNNNQITAHKKYKNKRLIVEGIVTLIARSHETNYYIINLSLLPPAPNKTKKKRDVPPKKIAPHNALLTPSYIICQFNTKRKKTLRMLTAGDRVIVQGRFELDERKLIIKGCSILRISKKKQKQ